MNGPLLITGGSGKLGTQLVNLFPDSLHPGRSELDITDDDSVSSYMSNHRPATVIHAAATTTIRRCEDEKELAWKTNVQGTRNLVDAVSSLGARFLYVSTACVFYGDRGMYTEADLPNPKNYYALSKLLGEVVVAGLEGSLIVRTNFVAREKWHYGKAFTDRYGTYLFADGVAEGIRDVLGAGLEGTVHVAGDRKVSMFELARMVSPEVQPMTMADYQGPPLTIDMSLDSNRWKRYKLA